MEKETIYLFSAYLAPVEYYTKLLAEKCRAYFKNTLYAGRVLGGQCRDRTHGVYAIGGHRLNICLDAGASTGITSSDC